MRGLFIALLAASGCGDVGIALDLTVEPDCEGAASRIRTVRFTVDAQPTVSKPTFDLVGASLFANLGQSNRVMLLLPDPTWRVNVRAVALDGGGATLGSGATSDIFFNGPVVRPTSLLLRETNCAMPIRRDGGAMSDLAAVDLAGVDLRAPHSVIGASAQGAFVNDVYEGEGSQQQPTNGVAVMISGSGFNSSAMVTTDYGEIGPSFASPSGASIATSLKLNPDSNVANLQQQRVTLTITQGGVPLTASFQIMGLPELVVPAQSDSPTPMTGALMYSSLTVMGTLQLSGPNRGFLWVTGLLSGGGTIRALPAAGGKRGCALTELCSTGMHGEGHGENAELALVNSGSGASYGTVGDSGAGGAPPGALYGDASLFGQLGGSGGGAGGGVKSTGGQGGGVLRVWAGKVVDVSFTADGEDGKFTGTDDGGGGGGGGGSGGSLLVQSPGGISSAQARALSAAGGAGGMGFGGISFQGGNGGGGRVRLDVGVPINNTNYAAVPALDFEGAMIAADWPSAFPGLPNEVKIVCGRGTQFRIEIDDVPRSTSKTCDSATLQTVSMTVPISPPLNTGGMHRVCARILSSNPSPPPSHYAAPYQEDLNCRSIAVASD